MNDRHVRHPQRVGIPFNAFATWIPDQPITVRKVPPYRIEIIASSNNGKYRSPRTTKLVR